MPITGAPRLSSELEPKEALESVFLKTSPPAWPQVTFGSGCEQPLLHPGMGTHIQTHTQTFCLQLINRNT